MLQRQPWKDVQTQQQIDLLCVQSRSDQSNHWESCFPRCASCRGKIISCPLSSCNSGTTLYSPNECHCLRNMGVTGRKNHCLSLLRVWIHYMGAPWKLLQISLHVKTLAWLLWLNTVPNLSPASVLQYSIAPGKMQIFSSLLKVLLAALCLHKHNRCKPKLYTHGGFWFMH